MEQEDQKGINRVTFEPKDPDQALIICQRGMRTGWPERESASEMSSLIPLMLDSTLRSETASSKKDLVKGGNFPDKEN